jgi:hypothetical protein
MNGDRLMDSRERKLLEMDSETDSLPKIINIVQLHTFNSLDKRTKLYICNIYFAEIIFQSISDLTQNVEQNYHKIALQDNYPLTENSYNNIDPPPCVYSKPCHLEYFPLNTV